MADIAAVRQKILQEFEQALKKYPKPRTASGAQNYAHQVGAALRLICKRNIGEDVLTDGFLTPEAAEALIRDPLSAGWKIVAEATGEMQTKLNISSGYHVRATPAPVNQSRVNGMVSLASGEEFDQVETKVFQCYDNIMRSSVDATIRRNFTDLHDAGVKVEVVRTYMGDGHCDWCARRAGTYDYDDVAHGGEVWERHLDCNCLIETRVGKQRQRSYYRYRDEKKQEEINSEIKEERKQTG